MRWKENDRQQSEVINRFWALDNAGGLAPLLVGMGAATMSFFPTRRALIGEGATEMLLLPKMLKEAIGKNALGFQIIHGLSNFKLSGIPTIDKTMAKAVFITDNDAGGEKLRGNLAKAGIGSECIFCIGNAQSGLTIEDLVDEAVWLEAVNSVAMGCRPPIKIESAPLKGRIAALPVELQTRKIDIAYTVLDCAIRNPEIAITATQHINGLRQLAEKVDAIFRSNGRNDAD